MAADLNAGRWASAEALRRLWLERTGPPADDPRIEGAFNAVTEDLVDAIGASDSDRLMVGHKSLRELYSKSIPNVSASGVAVESESAFWLGRLVGLLDVAADAIRRVAVGGVEAELDGVVNESFSIDILESLYRKGGNFVKSSDVTHDLGCDKSAVSRKIPELVSRRLVTSRRLGNVRLSRLTRSGTEVVRRLLAARRSQTNLADRVRHFVRKAA